MPSGSEKSVYSFHVFEHLSDIPALRREVERVLASEGEMLVVVPHFAIQYTKISSGCTPFRTTTTKPYLVAMLPNMYLRKD